MFKAQQKVTTSEKNDSKKYVILGNKQNTNKPTISLPALNIDEILVVCWQISTAQLDVKSS